MTTIDLTPTWGEVGNMVRRLIESESHEALMYMKPEIARAFATAEALKAILHTLSDEQHETVSKVLNAELTKQGY